MQFSTVEWKNGMPYSPEFGVIYFSVENGRQETEHVFVQGNQLESRFKFAQHGFTIIETGFGTGLNFFTVTDKWLQMAPAQAQLTFISIEKYPLNHSDMQQACECWPEFSRIQQQFLALYASIKPGLNDWQVTNNISLQLWIADALDALSVITQPTDAWLLDGFAPAKNPAMWNEWLFARMAQLSNPGISTFATFTSAGHARRGLQSAGFEVSKHPGYGKKREMSSGYYRGNV